MLDIGCGGGFLAEEFAKIGCAVTGIDPSAPNDRAGSGTRGGGRADDHLSRRIRRGDPLRRCDVRCRLLLRCARTCG